MISSIHMNYIRELVHDKNITLHYCLIEDQIADIFTKSFTEKRFAFLRTLLGIKGLILNSYFEGGFSQEVFPTSVVLCSIPVF